LRKGTSGTVDGRLKMLTGAVGAAVKQYIDMNKNEAATLWHIYFGCCRTSRRGWQQIKLLLGRKQTSVKLIYPMWDNWNSQVGFTRSA